MRLVRGHAPRSANSVERPSHCKYASHWYLVRLTANDAPDYAPAWSPDGEWIVFVSERHGPSEIYVVAADGTRETRLTSNDEDDSNPRWLAVDR